MMHLKVMRNKDDMDIEAVEEEQDIYFTINFPFLAQMIIFG